MKAFILAAGRGQRLRPLTDTLPKPLLLFKGKPLIVHHIERLASAGFREIIINVSFLAEQIKNHLQNGEKWGVKITYSFEPKALESGGGIFQALPLLGEKPFLLISADIYTDYPFKKLIHFPKNHVAHLVLAPRLDFPADFHLQEDGLLSNRGKPKYTYANIGVIDPILFEKQTAGRFPLGPLLREAVEKQTVTGEIYQGEWENITTASQYEMLASA